MARIALDTNVLVYAEGVERHPDDRRKVLLSQAIIRGLTRNSGWSAAVQAFAELHTVLVRRALRTPQVATRRVRELALSCSAAIPTSEAVFDEALTLAAHHHVQVYDAIIVAAAAEAGAELLLSEDLHDGFAWRGVTVTNPYKQAPDPRVAALLK